MPSPEISPLALAFLTDHIRSLEDLQVLMAVQHADTRWWDATTLSREVGIDPRTAQRSLDHLTRHNLLDIRVTDALRYQFRPATDDLRAAVVACAQEYRRNPIAVVQRVGRRGTSSVRDFADAFRIRTDDDR